MILKQRLVKICLKIARRPMNAGIRVERDGTFPLGRFRPGNCSIRVGRRPLGQGETMFCFHEALNIRNKASARSNRFFVWKGMLLFNAASKNRNISLFNILCSMSLGLDAFSHSGQYSKLLTRGNTRNNDNIKWLQCKSGESIHPI
jgi:hypothetical protein